MSGIEVHGAGLAGSSAAIAARLCGVEVDLYDPSPFPRQKVCGEFLSPEVLPVLDSLGLGQQFLELKPVRYTQLHLQFGTHSQVSALSEPAFGLSRFALDHLLVRHAQALGATLHRQRAPQPATQGQGIRPTVTALGRHGSVPPASAPRGQRYFGFKAHFQGDPRTPLTLYFDRSTYVGVNQVEGGFTNVCGIALESELAAVRFRIDNFLATLPGFSALLAPLRRSMSWITTGPVLYIQEFKQYYNRRYPAGDALSFLDPFTGSGQLCALLTGAIAGFYAAHHAPVDAYLDLCRMALKRPFLAASAIRAILRTPFAATAAGFVPVSWLMWATRPVMTAKVQNVLEMLKKENRRILGGRYPPVGSLTWAR
ncbi:MAG: hypothetical protein IPJ98_15075 [Bryobacterales bacterium]|nr:hypothetical protein [Bryobacterales bacterium]